jgi:hypothetical protein
MKLIIKLPVFIILLAVLCLSFSQQAMAATNEAVNGGGAFALTPSAQVTINLAAAPTLVKAIFDPTTNTCLAADDSDAVSCGGNNSVSVASGTNLTMVIYVANASGVTLNDIRFNDVLDISVPDGFVYQAGTLSYGTRLVAGMDKDNIYTAAQTTTADDAADSDGAPAAADPLSYNAGTVAAGGAGGDGVNETVNVAPGDVFAIAFDVQYQ